MSMGGWGDSQGSRALERAVGGRTRGIRAITRDAHRESGEGADAWTLVIGGEEGGLGKPDREDRVRVTDAKRRSRRDLHTAALVVDGFDEAAAHAFEEFVGDYLRGDGLPVDEVAYGLKAHSG